MRANFGGLVLVATNDETENWIRYAEECGRSDHLIIVTDDDSHGQWRFNFIQYELNRPGDPASRVDNLVTILMNLLEQTGRQGGGDDRIWQQAAEQLLRNVLMILITARTEFSLLDVQKFIDTIPQSLQAVESDSWKHSPTARFLNDAQAAYEQANRIADYYAIPPLYHGPISLFGRSHPQFRYLHLISDVAGSVGGHHQRTADHREQLLS